MGLTLALSNALSGLRSTETGLDTVSRNVANAGVMGYSRRTVSALEAWPSGVRDGAVQRVLDSTVQRQMRRETSGGAFTATMAGYLGRLDTSFGAPGDAGSLDTLFNGLTDKLGALVSEPGSTSARNGVAGAARNLAGALNRLSGDVQALRNDAESRISSAVSEVNAALQIIDRVEEDLGAMTDGNARADLLDERDRQVDKLASLMDIRVTDRGDGLIGISLSNGTSLYDGQPARLDFTPRGSLGPQSLYNPDPALSGVGQLRIFDARGTPIDLTTNNQRSGEIGALLTLRDETLVSAQDRLDSMAAALATEVPAPTAGEVPLFVDAGNGVAASPFTGTAAQQRGFAARIALNPVVEADSSKLVVTGAATLDGDPARPKALLDSLTMTGRSFSSGGATFSGSVGQFVRAGLDTQGAAAAEASMLDQGQQVVVSSLRERFAEASGVSVDQELANLVELQSAYAANARIISTVREMLDTLMRI
ncbi:MAG: flagellar hook-associated protein FlgK [Proteobacteria bacterium]|nr:flagellar hook-associated protein FlgK [Pseudomonadota bacterium]